MHFLVLYFYWKGRVYSEQKFWMIKSPQRLQPQVGKQNTPVATPRDALPSFRLVLINIRDVGTRRPSPVSIVSGRTISSRLLHISVSATIVYRDIEYNNERNIRLNILIHTLF